VRGPSRPEFADNKAIQEFKGVAPETTYENRALEKEFGALASKAYADKVGPATLLPQHLGNMYTASLYAGLLSLVHNKRDALVSKSLLLLSVRHSLRPHWQWLDRCGFVVQTGRQSFTVI
jgi:hypothetical protein